MTTYTVLAPRAADAFAEGSGAAERAVFVPDRFSWLTLLLTPLVLLRHRLWLALLAYVAVAVMMQVCVAYLGVPDTVSAIVMAGFSLLLAFELPRLRTAKLRRKGNADCGVVIARNRTEAERRFFTTLLRDDMALAGPAQRRETAGAAATPRSAAVRDSAPRDPAAGPSDDDDLLPDLPLVRPAPREAFPGAAPQPSVIGSFPGGAP